MEDIDKDPKSDNTEDEPLEELSDKDEPKDNLSDEDIRKEWNDKEVPLIMVENVSSLNELQESPIRRQAEKIKIPLSTNDQIELIGLTMRFDSEDHISGLSLPQIGINKRAFIFAVKEAPGVEQAFQKNIWINPVYRNARGATLDEDYEMCHSIQSNKIYLIGPVFRFNRIYYRAYDIEGRILEGEAQGYAARVIQHEIDHLDGRLFVDYVEPERLLPLPKYMEQLEAGTLEKLQTGVIPEEIAGGGT